MMISKSVRLQLCAIFLPALAIALLGVVSCQTGRLSSGVSLHLAKDGATGYAIVKPEKPAEVDDYAVSALTNFLFQKTGAVFPVVLPGQVSPANKHIFVGLSEPALKIAGEDPLAALKDQEYVAQSKGADIVLYGKGIHGNLYAVVDFMETTLGRRWYTKTDPPVVTVERDLVVKSFERKSGFSFAYRLEVECDNRFAYEQGVNMGFTELNARHKTWAGKDLLPPGVVSRDVMPGPVHTSFDYIPPTPPQARRLYEWITNRNYFASNPDFFSMDKTGHRKPRQLCFSNAELRKELTKNIQEHARRVTPDVMPFHTYHGSNSMEVTRHAGEKVILTLDADDTGVQFCACPECKKLEDKYASPGGPIFDYLFELCAQLKTEYPDIRIKTLAYRRSQTQKPPVLPPGMTFPDNLIIWFANVEDKLNVDWNHPVNHSSYEDLLAWRKLTPQIWTWYYPDIYSSCGPLPFVTIERLVTDIRLMRKADVEGVFYEFDTWPVMTRDGFSELQQYIYYTLTRDVDADVPALIKAFTDHQYGAAAPPARKYLDELEAGGRALKEPMPMTPRILDFNGPFAYLTPENIRRWQGYFDRMEKDAARDERCLGNVRRLRRTLDFATLARWHELVTMDPDYFRDYRLYKGRLAAMHKSYATAIADVEIIAKADGKTKPLPPQFDGIEASRIHRFVPSRIVYHNEPKTMLDAEAAFGYAAIVDMPDKPFTFGFYQRDTNKHYPKCKIEPVDIEPGRYRIYKLGEIQVTPNCEIWFSNWNTSLAAGSRLYAPGEDNKYEAYVSLKFAGVSYGGKEEKDLVLCDQVIFVKTNAR